MNGATRTHEAVHTALALAAAAMVPEEVRADHPDVGIAGRCTANWRTHEPDTRWLVAVLGGPLSGGEVIEWPPSEDAATGDERVAAALVEGLGLERHDYLDALATAKHLLARDDVQAVVRLVAVALKSVPLLDERQLRELLGPECLAHFNIDPEGTAHHET